MIEIFPYSPLSIFIAIVIKGYLSSHQIYSKIKLSFSYYPYKYDSPTTYFIIKSKFLTSENMNKYLKKVRDYSELATIIIIGQNIDYEELFKNHYRVFGVIDTTNNKSLTFIRDQVHFYLDGLYGLDSK